MSSVVIDQYLALDLWPARSAAVARKQLPRPKLIDG
jgi:hypothetical protein